MKAIAICIGCFLLVFIAYMDGIGSGVKAHQREDINAGVAHYVVDAKTGKTSFEYIKMEKAK